MNDGNYTFEQIEKYLAGELPLAEQNAFERRLNEDIQFAQEVEAQKRTHKALAVFSQIKTNERIKAIYKSERSSSSKNKRQWLSIAAGLAILILGATYVFAFMNYSNEAILTESFEAYPDRVTTMGSSVDEQLLDAVNAYNAKEYSLAINLFTQLPDSIQQTSLVQLYTGIAYMETDNHSSASTFFQQVASANNNLSEVALWYLALVHLKSGDIDKSKLLLERIVKEESYQSLQAEKILNKMDHLLRNLPGIN